MSFFVIGFAQLVFSMTHDAYRSRSVRTDNGE